MYENTQIGIATRVTGTGFQTICSSPANVIAVLCCCSATATAGMQLFHGVTASSSACGLVVFPSGSSSTYINLPVYCSGGITMNVGAIANPDITLFWNPA